MDRRTLLKVAGATPLVGLGGPALADGQDYAANQDQADEEDQVDGQDHAADDCPAGLVTIERDDTFEEAVSHIEAAIEERDLMLVLTLDHAENAAEVEMELPPTKLFLFGNPAMGTQLMREQRSIAIDLPMKLLVWEEDGVNVTYNDPTYLTDRHGIEGREEQLELIDEVLTGLATAGCDSHGES